MGTIRSLRAFRAFVEQIWHDRLGRRRELVWDDRIGDFNLDLRPCAHSDCPDLAGADLDGNPPPAALRLGQGRPAVLLVPRVADVGEAASAREGRSRPTARRTRGWQSGVLAVFAHQ